ncbi:hypothetical protein BLNAU_19554 [Blattamonas nauphoetae]|uniref:Uncharacterized protein n=1 Tax=Blattamonas nauphoetae TaxID=2049346 RepID=A0ABQ9X187_9EUKA|nr:hypothetical protein BLNAU_19554 [Blattamonas nauphoetae]
MSCFKPALLRLQSKFQNITQLSLPSDQPSPNVDMISSSESTLDWSTTTPSLAIKSSFSLNTAILSDTNSMSQLSDGSERSDLSLSTQPPSNSSLSSFTSQQEALRILTVLHSLITAPHSQPSDISNSPPPFHLREEPDFSSISHEPTDLNEKFSIHVFDEDDEATIVHKILRCHRLCTAVPPNQCITDMEQFVEGLTSRLESPNRQLQSAVFSLLFTLIRTFKDVAILQKLLFSLRFAFREGSIASQLILIHVVHIIKIHMYLSHKSISDPLSNFDWDGLIHRKNVDIDSFSACLTFIIDDFCLRRSNSLQLAKRIFVEFETNQHAVTRIASIITLHTLQQIPSVDLPMLGYCLIMSFFFGKTLPDPIIRFVWNHIDFSGSMQFIGFHPSFFLNHISSNCNRHSQPVLLLELLSERFIRSPAHSIFERLCLFPLDRSPHFLITTLFGLHPLFLRGLLSHHKALRIDDFLSIVLMISGRTMKSQVVAMQSLYSYCPPPLVVQFFAPPICIVRSLGRMDSFLSVFLKSLLISCAPFGECKSLAMIFKEFSTVRHRNTRLDKNELDLLQTVLDLHWLNIPATFDSPLLVFASSINGISLRDSDFAISDTDFSQKALEDNIILQTSRRTKKVSSRSTWPVEQSASLQSLFTLLLDEPSSLISVLLEFLTRIVRVSSDAVRMVLVWRGVLDIVILSISSSFFLEDYENGVALIGTLLGTMRRVEQSTRICRFNFSSFF